MPSVVLEARNLRHGFRRRQVLRDASLSLARGEIVALTGENGSGKTTLLRVLAGLLTPDEGDVVLSGKQAYCPQQPLVFERLTVAENFQYFGTALAVADWRAAMGGLLEEFHFAQYAKTLVSDVSGGTRQKLNVALSLLADPDVLLLDEPYAGLDWETYLLLWKHVDALRARQRALLVVSHFVHERARFDRVLKIEGGRICSA